ncbi:NAD-dependent malic enzyme [Rhodoblastus acidophilus]|uniref:NAD-dependent malic enzyme n=1 Tax=Candidatus Rhodoblastus alkanivorans TaxID=2954117 RepID=UPI001FAAB2A9|nr:NAD-dependent malic enzyme [Candidatus Rhodoblastus alkanivorans]MCI4680665.1 NAD-dependent malic enzyme [Candidatus Rhodoblastus alkanivorans]MDI4642723.1 NAD-dependent malic enzyme [Rhodoblastus acidophilus]
MTEAASDFITTALSGYDLLADSQLNKGAAFSEAERDAFNLHGLLPPNVLTLHEQVSRSLQALRAFETDLERYAFLSEIQDANETLFYALLVGNLEELLPIVYTPTVDAGCQQFSHLFHKPRGLFLSLPYKDRIDRILAQPHFDRVEAIVVTDGERILGLGDQGAGGMGIPIGKLALYTGCGGLNPATTLPILLDVGTDNPDRLADPLYIGWRHERVRGQDYDDFIEAFVSAVTARWPNVLLQWEDFAKSNATRMLERYRDRLCTFNDDVQGTAAVATGALLAAINVTGVPLTEQRVAVLGAGSAGCGIASLIRAAMRDAGLSDEEAGRRFFMVDRDGLLVERMAGLASFQLPFVQAKQAVADWKLGHPDKIDLLDVVRNAKPTALIGVSGQAGGFSESVVRAMAEFNKRPVIFPLSNPTSRAEATPQDIETWTEGRALIGVGSPFPPLTRDGARIKIDQTNNSYIFPGIGLGALAVGASRISDGMFMAAAKALAGISPARDNPKHNLLPPVSALRDVAVTVALAVALQAHKEGLAPNVPIDTIEARILARRWTPTYRPYRRAGAAES